MVQRPKSRTEVNYHKSLKSVISGMQREFGGGGRGDLYGHDEELQKRLLLNTISNLL
jgi:hypothetical protein